MKWKMNVPEMVAYRSFRPFYPLMAENQPMSVQLWAVWALHHVCCNKGKQKSNLNYEISFHWSFLNSKNNFHQSDYMWSSLI